MSQPITFQRLPLTADVPAWLTSKLQENDGAVAHSTQELTNSDDLTSRMWVVKGDEASHLFFAEKYLSELSVELDVTEEFTATLDVFDGDTFIQFVQNEEELGEAIVVESQQLTFVKAEKKEEGAVAGYSYKQIGAVSLVALLLLGLVGTYATGTFPFNAAQKA